MVADEGVDRFLIKLAGGLNRLERAEGTAIYVGSGVTLAQAAVFAAHHGLTGLEFAHGIPGTMGGGVFMNAGAYEGEMCIRDRDAAAALEAGTLCESDHIWVETPERLLPTSAYEARRVSGTGELPKEVRCVEEIAWDTSTRRRVR